MSAVEGDRGQEAGGTGAEAEGLEAARLGNALPFGRGMGDQRLASSDLPVSRQGGPLLAETGRAGPILTKAERFAISQPERVSDDSLPIAVSRGDVVWAARQWIGTPYLHQASRRGAGADCLGLIRGLWREFCGAEPEAVPAYTPDWSEASGDERLMAAACRHLRRVGEPGLGSVLLFRMREHSVAKHLGIVTRLGDTGALAFVHAYSGQGVVECSLSMLWRRHLVASFDFPWVSG